MLIALLGKYLAPYKWSVLVVCLFQFAQTIASLYLPGLNAKLIDEGVAQGDIAYIWNVGALMLGVTVVQVVCNLIAIYIGARVAMAVSRDLRAAVFAKVETFGSREVRAFGTPTLITRNTNDVQQVQLLLFVTLTLLVSAPMTGLGGLLLALREDVPLSGVFLVVLPVLVITLGILIVRMRPLFRLMQTRIDTLNHIMREQITGVRVVRAFVREQHEVERFGRANELNREIAVQTGRLMAVFFPLLMGFMNLSVVLALWWGAGRVGSGNLEVGQLIAFQQYLIQTLMAVMMSTFIFMIWPRSEVAAERISEVLKTVPEIALDVNVPPIDIEWGQVHVGSATYSYPGAEYPVLQDVSFTANPGEVVAIVGSTGSGKSTLLSLISRLLDTTEGSILLDGYNVKSIRPVDTWAAVGLVPQKAFLFSGTIASNLRYGDPDASDEDLWEALRIAQAADFVSALPEGLEAPVSQGGTNFSGGQRQRLSIARALVKKPVVYLFDDSFSALDYATDAKLRAELAKVTQESTVIIVAQRISTVRNADQIIVLDEGHIVGLGKHDELMEACDVYREIVLSQISEEEAS